MNLKAVALTAMALAGVWILASSGAEAGGGCHNGVFSDEVSTAVEMAGNCFESTVVRVQPGESVTWTNSDEVTHTVTGAANTWGDDTEIRKGESISYRFDDSGVFPYFCYLHPSMVGAVVVGDGQATGASAANDSVKAVSAQAAGDEAEAEDAPASSDSDDGGTDELLIAGIGLFALVLGVGGTVTVRRRAR